MGGPGSGRKPGVKNQNKNRAKQSNKQKVYSTIRKNQATRGRTNRSQNRQTAARIAYDSMIR